jgi:DNA-binding CsgD family transcriptional regulator
VHGAQNPLGFRSWAPADGALRQSARIRRADLERLPFHGEFLAPNRITDALKVWLWSSPESVACIQLWRHGGVFSRRDQDVLGVLQHDLIRIRRQALDGVRWPARRVELTAREAEMLLWAVRGHSHAQIGARLGVSPATVGKHLEHAYEKLDVRSRAEAVDRLLLSGPLD